MSRPLAAALILPAVLLALTGCGTRPRTEAAVYVHNLDPGREAVERKLGAPLPELRFERTPLGEALDRLADAGDVGLNVNWGALEVIGITRTQSEVTVALKGVTVAQGLRTLLASAAGRELLLDYAILGRTVKVSTYDDLAAMRTIVIYDVTDLLLIADSLAPDRFQLLIYTMILPDSWAPAGDATMQLFDGLLVVKHNPLGHRKLHTFLKWLTRAANAKMKRTGLEPPGQGRQGRIRGGMVLRARSSLRELVDRNGFAISSEARPRLVDFYEDETREGLPPLVTTDALLHAYSIIFSDAMMALERRQAERLARWQQQLWRRVSATDDSLLDAAQAARLRGLVAVGCRLLDPKFTARKVSLPDWVDDEVQRVLGGAGLHDSPAWDRKVEYSTFKPRGFYAGDAVLERFFRAWSWWSKVPLRPEKEAELRIAAALGRLVAADHKGYLLLTAPYGELLGSAEDADVAELYATAAGTADEGAAIGLDDLRRAVEQLTRKHRPTIRTGHTPGELREPGEIGVHLFPPRYVFGSEVFTMTTTWKTKPPLGQYHLPGGLDLMAAMGSDPARKLALESAHAPVRRALGEQLDKARDLLAERRRRQSSIVHQHHSVIRTLLAPAVTKRHPEFMRNDAYVRKSLQTALAGWAEDRHRWQLHAKESSGLFGDDLEEPPPGYVEPNVAFWRELIELTRRTRQVLRIHLPEEDPRWEKLDGLLAHCLAIAEAQLAGRPLTKSQRGFFAEVYEQLSAAGESDEPEHPDPVIAFVHRSMLPRQVVHVGTGYPQAIYAVCPVEGKPWLCKGGVMTYREAITDGEILNDREWRKMLDEGRAPGQPPWTTDFCLPPDEALRNDNPPF